MNNKELIEFVFYHEQDIKRAVFEKREDGCLPKTGGGGSGHCRVSDPTAQNAIRKALEVPAVMIEYGAKTCGRRNSITLRHPEKWLKLAAEVRNYFNGTNSGLLLKMRYTDNLTRQEICKELNISTNYYNAMRCNVIRFAEGYAAGIGLINARHKI